MRNIVGSAIVAALAAGCSVGRQPSPTNVPTTPTTVGVPNPPGVTALGPYSVSGIVTSDDGNPLSGAYINAWIDTGTLGYSYWAAHGQLVTDAAGTYRMTGLPLGAQLTLQADRDGYQQQCAAPATNVQGDTTVNLTLISNAHVTATPASAPGFRTVSGTVVQASPSGKEPISGAFVDFEPLEDITAASTYSDAAGQFGLCGLPASGTISISAGLGQRVAYVRVPPGQTTVEIVLP